MHVERQRNVDVRAFPAAKIFFLFKLILFPTFFPRAIGASREIMLTYLKHRRVHRV